MPYQQPKHPPQSLWPLVAAIAAAIAALIIIGN